MKFELRGACFAYGTDRPLFERINLSLSKGEILTVFSPDGTGKTSLLRAALGFVPFQRGDDFLNGKPVEEFSARELFRGIAYIPRARRYSFAYTVGELVLLGRAVCVGFFSQLRKHDKHIARSCLEKIGITNITEKLCSRISSGELQMTLIARALAAEPELIVLDEPEASLDFKDQYRILKTVQGLKEQKGLAFFINTHFPEYALQLADRVLLLYPGRCSESGLIAELLTEEKLQKLYSLPVQIAELQFDQRNYHTVIPFALQAVIIKDKQPEGANMYSTSLYYLENDRKWLMLHRVTGKNDINKGEYVGVGGKFLEGESPGECTTRKVFEGTGYTLTHYRYVGIATFASGHYEVEHMHLFLADGFTGEYHDMKESISSWIPKEEILKLLLWEGDHIFLPLLRRSIPFFPLKLCYEDDALTTAKLNGGPLPLRARQKEAEAGEIPM